MTSNNSSGHIPKNESDCASIERYFREHHLTSFLAKGFQTLYSRNVETQVFQEYGNILESMAQKEPYNLTKFNKGT